MIRPLLGVTLLLALAAPACGAGRTSTATSRTTSTSSIPATSSHATTPAGDAAASGGPCQGSHLTAKVADAGDGAAATRYLTIQVTNTGSTSCTTSGYFTVSSYGTGGQVIAALNTHVAGTPARLTVASGAALNFTIGIDDLPSGPQGSCPRLASLHLVAPGDTALVHLELLDAQGEGTQVVECPGPLSVTIATAA